MLRLTTVIRDTYGARYRISVYDSDYSGDATAFSTYGESLVHEGDPDDPLKRIVPTRFSFNFILNDPTYSSTDRDGVVSFYEDLANSYEGRFYLIVREYSEIPGTGVMLFRGKVISDIGDLTLNYHRDIKLTAIDGLTSLKDVEFRPTDYSDLLPDFAIKTYSFNELFNQILMKSDVNQYFYVDTSLNGVSNVLLTTAANWTESKSVAGDIWEQVRKRNTYFEQKSPTYRKYGNCYDALVDLLTGFNARIIFSNGVYHIEQIGYLDNPTLTRYKYDDEGNAGGSYGNKTLYNITTDNDLVVLSDPSIKRLPALKAVELVQAKSFTNFLNGFNISYPDNPGPHDFGDVIANGKRLVMSLYFKLLDTSLIGYIVDAGDFVANTEYVHTLSLEFTIKIGSYYLKSLDFVESKRGQNGLYDPIASAEWTLTPSVCQFTTIRKIKVPTYTGSFAYLDTIIGWLDSLSAFAWIVESLEIPTDDTFVFELSSCTYDINGDSKTVTLGITQRSRIIFGSGYNDLYELPDDISIFEVGDIRNTLIYKLELSYFDSGPRLFDQLMIKNSTYVTTDEPTVEWTDPDMGETLPIQNLVMKQILGMRSLPTQVINVILQRTDSTVMTYDGRWNFGSDMYIPTKYEHKLSDGTYAISLYKILKDYSGIDPIDTGEPDTPTTPFPTPDRTLDAFKNNSLSILAYWKFKNVVDNYVVIPSDESLLFYVTGSDTPDTLSLYFWVFVNGILQEYVDYTTLTFPLVGGELEMGQYTLNPDEDRFYFAYNDDTTIIIKYIRPA